MESREVEFTAKCVKGNLASNACCEPACKSPSLMCNNQKCSCIQPHLQCEHMTALNKLLAKFQQKGNLPRDILAMTYSWYENQLKLIKIEMEQLKKMMDRLQFKLFGEEEKLYYYMIEGKSDLVLPSLVASVHKMLYDKANDPQGKVNQTKQLLEKQSGENKKVLNNVRRLVEENVGKNAESTVSCNFKFSQYLHNPDFTIVDDQTVRVKNYVNFGAALLEPSLLASNSTSCKVRLRITRATSSGFMFGVCQLTPNFKITDSDIYNKIQHGSFTCYGQDDIDLGNSSGHRKESSNIMGYQTNDQIEIEYWKETERVEVRNTTKGTKSVSFIKSDKNLSLYFAVLLREKNHQIQIINAKCLI